MMKLSQEHTPGVAAISLKAKLEVNGHSKLVRQHDRRIAILSMGTILNKGMTFHTLW